uniref:Uncharacterized protein n=1 Tax=Rhizophagus irregularis (strain DAOM 181602 / DAOM 197198 / MUCL 43194) TaxID=747089 RepID=U9URX3_RHIID
MKSPEVRAKALMYGIVSTAVDWVMIKLVSSSDNSEVKVDVLLSSLSSFHYQSTRLYWPWWSLSRTCLGKSSGYLIARLNLRNYRNG